MQYCQVFTSVEQTAQALRVLDVPIAKQRTFAGPIVERSARLLWNFRESDVPECMREPKLYTLGQDYNCIISYTRNDLKEKLVAVAGTMSLEAVRMVSALPMESNQSLRLRLYAPFAGRGGTARPETVDAAVARAFGPWLTSRAAPRAPNAKLANAADPYF